MWYVSSHSKIDGNGYEMISICNDACDTHYLATIEHHRQMTHLLKYRRVVDEYGTESYHYQTELKTWKLTQSCITPASGVL